MQLINSLIYLILTIRSLPRSFLASGRFNASFVILLLFIRPHRIKSNPIYDFLIDPRRDYVLVAIHRNSCQQPSEKMGSKGIYGKLRTVIITSTVRQKQSSSGKGIIRWDWDRLWQDKEIEEKWGSVAVGIKREAIHGLNCTIEWIWNRCPSQ